MKVVRILTYEGPVEWLETQVGNSLPDGIQGKGGAGRYSRDNNLLGALAPGSIKIQTVVDERPSQVPDPDVVEWLNTY